MTKKILGLVLVCLLSLGSVGCRGISNLMRISDNFTYGMKNYYSRDEREERGKDFRRSMESIKQIRQKYD